MTGTFNSSGGLDRRLGENQGAFSGIPATSIHFPRACFNKHPKMPPLGTNAALSALVVLLAAAAANSSTDGPPPDDWLLGNVPSVPEVVAGVLGGVPTLTLRNGLCSRTFALPKAVPTPPPPPVTPAMPCPSNCTSCGNRTHCCANPGGRWHHGPNPGEQYPYYGLPCTQQSDCSQCTVDGMCTCEQITPGSPYKCCRPKQPAPATSNHTGFGTIGLARSGFAGREHETGQQLLRATAPEGLITLDGVSYSIGGLAGQKNFAFLNDTLLLNMSSAPGAFVYQTHRTGVPVARFEWTPGARFSDAEAAWPPRGITLEIDFAAPDDAPTAHQGVVVTVVYAMYDNLPLYEKHVVVSSIGSANVSIDALTMDVLYATPEALGYWPRVIDGLLTSSSSSGRIHMQSEMSRGGATTALPADPGCPTCSYDSGGVQKLVSEYPLGPGAQIGPQGFHGRNFSS